jgi:hypothetical protein
MTKQFYETDETGRAGDSPERRQEERPEADYEVGYGKPPKQHRFKPGQSGNSRGRPEGKKNIATQFREALDEPITVRVQGKKRKMSRQQAIIERLTLKAIEGDPRAVFTVFKLAEQTGELKPDAGRASGVIYLPMKPKDFFEWQRDYGEMVKGTPIPQNIIDQVNKATRRKQ